MTREKMITDYRLRVDACAYILLDKSERITTIEHARASVRFALRKMRAKGVNFSDAIELLEYQQVEKRSMLTLCQESSDTERERYYALRTLDFIIAKDIIIELYESLTVIQQARLSDVARTSGSYYDQISTENYSFLKRLGKRRQGLKNSDLLYLIDKYINH